MRVELDETRDKARIYVSEERQSYERGATYLVLAYDDSDTPRDRPPGVRRAARRGARIRRATQVRLRS